MSGAAGEVTLKLEPTSVDEWDAEDLAFGDLSDIPESALGRAEVSSEFVGLPNVFIAAGARYVIGSLWRVNQLASVVLVDRCTPAFLVRLLRARRHLVRCNLEDEEGNPVVSNVTIVATAVDARATLRVSTRSPVPYRLA
jgi:hypothetical protein